MQKGTEADNDDRRNQGASRWKRFESSHSHRFLIESDCMLRTLAASATENCRLLNSFKSEHRFLANIFGRMLLGQLLEKRDRFGASK